MTPEEMREMFGADDPFSDFFHTFFGGEAGGGFSGARRPRAAGARTGSRVDDRSDARGSVLGHDAAPDGARARASTVEVRIPAGVKDGARVRAAGEGEPASGGGNAGDLYLIVRVLPHAQFERRGQDLYVHVSVPVTTRGPRRRAAGADADRLAPLRLKVPELTQAGRVFRLRGHGMPAVGKPDERGDLVRDGRHQAAVAIVRRGARAL